jgi:hypothetical protein
MLPIPFFLRFTQLHRKLYKGTARCALAIRSRCTLLLFRVATSRHLNRSPSSSRHSERLRMVRIVREEKMKEREGRRAGCGQLVDGLHRHWPDCCGACPHRRTVGQRRYAHDVDEVLCCTVQYMKRKRIPYQPTSRVVKPRNNLSCSPGDGRDKFQLDRFLPFLLPSTIWL